MLFRIVEDRISFMTACAFSLDGSCIISASMKGGKLQMWETATCQLLHILEGHVDIVEDFTLSPDSLLIISASDDHKLKMWMPLLVSYCGLWKGIPQA